MFDGLRKWRRGVRVLLAAGLLLLGGVWLAQRLAPSVLTVAPAPRKSDLIVVLGGEAQSRAELAARFFAEGYGTNVIVTGIGDWDRTRHYLTNSGVPPEVILVDQEALNTRENARNAARLARERGATRLLLVTSWFHARRAARTFQTLAPGFAISVAQAPYQWHGSDAWWYRAKGLLPEYLKLAWYWLRYGIRPWATDSPAPDGS
jgi:uncharacterized SAM-binding protein YcdF (DUF218 family)